VVGVNGVGKTTTIVNYLSIEANWIQSGIGAADYIRAAAVRSIMIWGEQWMCGGGHKEWVQTLLRGL